MIVDTILRLFCIIVGGIILVIVMVGGLIVIAREFERNPWALAKSTFLTTFIMVLVWGATTGVYFISPTDSWLEIIIESLAVSLISTVIMVMGAGVYFRWRRETERTKGKEVSMSEKASSIDKLSKCSNCEEDMEKGYVIASGGAIFWSEKPRKWMTLSFKRLILGSPRLSQANVEGYLCSKCKIVSFSYEKEGGEIVG